MNKNRLILMAILWMLPFVCVAASEKTYDGVTIMSYNIRCDSGKHKDGTNSWEFRWKSVINMIDACGADVIGLQEVTPFQLPLLKDYCEKYRFKGVGRDDGKKKGEQTAIMYRADKVALVKWGAFWLSETPDKPGKGWDAACPRVTTWAIFRSKKSGERFMVVNTHLDHKGAQAQANGLKLIMDKIQEINKKAYPVVLMGDLNIKPDDPAFASMEGHGFQDARLCADKTDSCASFHGWGKRALVIDYIFAKGFSAIPMFRTVNEKYNDEAGEPHFVSDHNPIISCLIF